MGAHVTRQVPHDGVVGELRSAAVADMFPGVSPVEQHYPQIRHLHVSDALTRATLGVVCGPAGGDKGEAEQALLDRMLAEHPQVFGPDRLWIMDRNLCATRRLIAFPA